MAAVAAVLFDLYETLVQPDWELLLAGRAALAERAGADFARMRRQWERTFQDRLRGSHGGLEGDLAALLAGCGVEVEPLAVRELAEIERANWARGVRAYDDVPHQLARLRRHGIRTAIVSNASREAGSVVQTLGLDRLVDAVVLSCDVGVVKPDPAIYLLALERLATSPSSALLVDDVPVNLEAARALGMRTALMVRAEPAREPPAGHPRIGSLEELWPLLNLSERARAPAGDDRGAG